MLSCDLCKNCNQHLLILVPRASHFCFSNFTFFALKDLQICYQVTRQNKKGQEEKLVWFRSKQTHDTEKWKKTFTWTYTSQINGRKRDHVQIAAKEKKDCNKLELVQVSSTCVREWKFFFNKEYHYNFMPDATGLCKWNTYIIVITSTTQY